MGAFMNDQDEKFVRVSFSKALHEELKKRINAKIYTHVTDDDVLDIAIERMGISFYMKYGNITGKIIKEYPIDIIVNEVVTAYRKHINGMFFYI